MKKLKKSIRNLYESKRNRILTKKSQRSKTSNNTSRISKITKRSQTSKHSFQRRRKGKKTSKKKISSKSLSNLKKNTGMLLIDIKTTTNLIQETLDKSHSIRMNKSKKNSKNESRLIRDIYSSLGEKRTESREAEQDMTYRSINFEKSQEKIDGRLFKTLDPDLEKNRESDEMIKLEDLSLMIPENIHGIVRGSEGYFFKNREVEEFLDNKRNGEDLSEHDTETEKKVMGKKILPGKNLSEKFSNNLEKITKSKKRKILSSRLKKKSPQKNYCLSKYSTHQISSPTIHYRTQSSRVGIKASKRSLRSDFNVTDYLKKITKKKYLIEGMVKDQYNSPRKKRNASNPGLFSQNNFDFGSKKNSSRVFNRKKNKGKFFSQRGNSVSYSMNKFDFGFLKNSDRSFKRKLNLNSLAVDIDKIDRVLRGKSKKKKRLKSSKKKKFLKKNFYEKIGLLDKIGKGFKEDEENYSKNTFFVEKKKIEKSQDEISTLNDSKELIPDEPCIMTQEIDNEISNLEIFFDKCKMEKIYDSKPFLVLRETGNSGKIEPDEKISGGKLKVKEFDSEGRKIDSKKILKKSSIGLKGSFLNSIDSGGAILLSKIQGNDDKNKINGFNKVFNFSNIAQGGYYINNYDRKSQDNEEKNKKLKNKKFSKNFNRKKNFEYTFNPNVENDRRVKSDFLTSPVDFSSRFDTGKLSEENSSSFDENTPKRFAQAEFVEDEPDFIQLSNVIFGKNKESIMSKIEEMREEEAKKSRMRVNRMFGGIQNPGNKALMNSPKIKENSFFQKFQEEKNQQKMIEKQLSSSKKYKPPKKAQDKKFINQQDNFNTNTINTSSDQDIIIMSSSTSGIDYQESSKIRFTNQRTLFPDAPKPSSVEENSKINFSTEGSNLTTNNQFTLLTEVSSVSGVKEYQDLKSYVEEMVKEKKIEKEKKGKIKPNLMLLDIPQALYDSTEDGAKQMFSSRVREQDNIDFLDKDLSRENSESNKKYENKNFKDVQKEFDYEDKYGINLLERFEHDQLILEKDEEYLKDSIDERDLNFDKCVMQLSASPSRKEENLESSVGNFTPRNGKTQEIYIEGDQVIEENDYAKKEIKRNMVIQKDTQEKINTLGMLPNVQLNVQRRPRSPQSQSTINSDLLNKIPNHNRPSLAPIEDLSINTEKNENGIRLGLKGLNINSCKNSSKKKMKFGQSSFQIENSKDLDVFKKSKFIQRESGSLHGNLQNTENFSKDDINFFKEEMKISVHEDTPKFGIENNPNLQKRLFNNTRQFEEEKEDDDETDFVLIKEDEEDDIVKERIETEEDLLLGEDDSYIDWTSEKKTKRKIQNEILKVQSKDGTNDNNKMLNFPSCATFGEKSSKKFFKNLNSEKFSNCAQSLHDDLKTPINHIPDEYELEKANSLKIEKRFFFSLKKKIEIRTLKNIKKTVRSKPKLDQSEKQDKPGLTFEKIIAVKINNKWSISPWKYAKGVNRGFIKIDEVRSSLEVDNSDIEGRFSAFKIREFDPKNSKIDDNFNSTAIIPKNEKLKNLGLRKKSQNDKIMIRDMDYLSPESEARYPKREKSLKWVKKKISEFRATPKPILTKTPFKLTHDTNKLNFLHPNQEYGKKSFETCEIDSNTEYVELTHKKEDMITEPSIGGISSNIKSEKFEKLGEENFFKESQISARKLNEQRKGNSVHQGSLNFNESCKHVPMMQSVKRSTTSENMIRNFENLVKNKKRIKDKNLLKKKIGDLRIRDVPKKISRLLDQKIMGRREEKRSATQKDLEKSLNLRKNKKKRRKKKKKLVKKNPLSKKNILEKKIFI